MKKEPKTIAQLYEQFMKQYKLNTDFVSIKEFPSSISDASLAKLGINEIANSQSLMTLLGYLTVQMRRCNGKFYHIPSDYLCVLIKSHLQYDPMAADELYEAAKTEKHDCRLCNWVETCSFIEYGLTDEIDTCKNFKKTRVLSK